ncbi:hypothetical protein [Streptomyces sp. BP-8]|uniref:Uncharacterized protein n=1 Tax=Streptomyces sirii TaxID=3127701 RepID=A0ABZ2QHS1_9ACTN
MVTTADLNSLATSLQLTPQLSRSLTTGERVSPRINPDPSALVVRDGALTLPINVARIKWDAIDHNGNVVAGGEYNVGGSTTLVPEFVFKPQLFEPSSNRTPPEPKSIRIRATVTLSVALATGTVVSSVSTPLLSANLLVTPLPIPTIFAMFRHKNFSAKDGAAVLLLVPEYIKPSPGTINQVTTKLENLRNDLDLLADLGGWFLPELSAITQFTDSVNAQPRVHLRVANEYRNLNSITLIQRSWWQNDTEAEDEISSVMLFGLGKSIQCYQHRRFGGRSFKLRTATAEPLSSVTDLSPDIPPSQPANKVEVVDNKKGGFENRLSSMKFL